MKANIMYQLTTCPSANSFVNLAHGNKMIPIATVDPNILIYLGPMGQHDILLVYHVNTKKVTHKVLKYYDLYSYLSILPGVLNSVEEGCNNG